MRRLEAARKAEVTVRLVAAIVRQEDAGGLIDVEVETILACRSRPEVAGAVVLAIPTEVEVT